MKRYEVKQMMNDTRHGGYDGRKENAMLSEAKIIELAEKGFKRWTKGNIDRLYINATQLGLVCGYYNTGNISWAEFNGESISNSQARRYKAAKTFVDVKTGAVYSDYETLKDAAMELAGIAEE